MRAIVQDGQTTLEGLTGVNVEDIIDALFERRERIENQIRMLEASAAARETFAREHSRGRVANRRVAGELRQEAGELTAVLGRVADLLRSIKPITGVDHERTG